MQVVLISLALFLIWGGAIYWSYWHRKRQNKELDHLTREHFDAREIKWVEYYCRLWHRLDPREKEQLRRHVRLFLYNVYFEPCGGLKEVREEMKMAVAVNASLLLLGGRQPFFENLRDVLVYPDEFIPEPDETEDEGEVSLGEATSNGNVLLSWVDVEDCGTEPFEGTNVVIHEFAHVVDVVERTEIGRAAYSAYFSLNAAEHFGSISERFVNHWKTYRETGQGILDEYAATNPAEFFAVATEFFFEVPKQFSLDYPEMYKMMTDIYGRLSYQPEPVYEKR